MVGATEGSTEGADDLGAKRPTPSSVGWILQPPPGFGWVDDSVVRRLRDDRPGATVASAAVTRHPALLDRVRGGASSLATDVLQPVLLDLRVQRGARDPQLLGG